MKTLKFTAHLLFKHYSKVKYNPNPYLSTISILTIFAFFHLLQILIITGSTTNVFTIMNTDVIWFKQLSVFWSLLPIAVILMIILPKNKLRILKYDETKMKHAYVYLIIYGILSFSLIFILAILKAR